MVSKTPRMLCYHSTTSFVIHQRHSSYVFCPKTNSCVESDVIRKRGSPRDENGNVTIGACQVSSLLCNPCFLFSILATCFSLMVYIFNDVLHIERKKSELLALAKQEHKSTAQVGK